MRVFLFLTFWVFGQIAQAHQLRGRVSDPSGAPVAYASVFIKNTTYGVATNAKGQFFLELKTGKHTVVFKAIGFKTDTQVVTISQEDVELNLTLTPSFTQLDAVNITADGEDPAYPIIRNAIAARKKNRYQAEEYSCDFYLKVSLTKEFDLYDTLSKDARDTVIDQRLKERMNFIETYGEFYNQAPSNYKEIRLAEKDLSTKKNGVTISIDGFDGNSMDYGQARVNRQLFKTELSSVNIDFYETLMDIPSLGDIPFYSPIGSGALLNYKYKLERTFFENGHWINQIQIIPRRRNAALYSGTIYILDESWRIKAIEVDADPTAVNFFNKFRIIQSYTAYSDSIWLIDREEYFYEIKEGSDIKIGHTYLHQDNYNLSPDLPKNFFNNEIRTTVDKAFNRDRAYWAGVRKVTLKPDEKKFLMERDSAITYHKTEEYKRKQDSISNRLNFWDYVLNGITHQNSIKQQRFYLYPLINQLQVIGIGGYRHALGGSYRKRFSKSTRIRISGELNYNFNHNDARGDFGFDYLYKPKIFAHFHGEYRNDYELLNPYASITNLLARGNYILEKFYSFGHELEIVNGLYGDFTAEYGQKEPIGIPLASWGDELFGGANTPSDFNPFNELVFEGRLKYTFNQKFRTAPYEKIILPSDWPSLILTYRKGIPGPLQSIADYDFLELQVIEDLPVAAAGMSRFRFWAGSFLTNRNLQIPDYRYFRRSDPYWFSNPLLSFQLLRPTENVIGTRNPYFQFNYLHNFEGTLLNKVPLIKRIGLQAVGGAGALYIEDINFRHTEAFAGVEWPFLFKGQLFKIGTYYTVGNSNTGNLNGEIKFGIDFFNPATNKWSY